MDSDLTGPAERDGASLVQGAVTSTVLTALFCALGFWIADDGCAGDGTFSLESALARPSGFCRATHLPGLPDTLGSALVVGALYLTPVLVVAAGWVAAAATGRRPLAFAGVAVGGFMTLAVLVLSATADVGYAGGG